MFLSHVSELPNSGKIIKLYPLYLLELVVACGDTTGKTNHHGNSEKVRVYSIAAYANGCRQNNWESQNAIYQYGANLFKMSSVHNPYTSTSFSTSPFLLYDVTLFIPKASWNIGVCYSYCNNYLNRILLHFNYISIHANNFKCNL